MTLALWSVSLSLYLQACFSISGEPGLGAFLHFRLCFPSQLSPNSVGPPAWLLVPPWSVSSSGAWRWLSHTLSVRPDLSQTKHGFLSHVVISAHCF